MPPKSKSRSVWKSANAQHFQVVHRSQRDPLIHDPEAGQHVLMAFDPANSSKAKGKSRAQLEQDGSLMLGKDGTPLRSNIGEAALYGVYYDDSQYDYMQHLRPIHDQFHSSRGGKDEQEETETIMISAPQKQKPKEGFTLKNDNQNEQGRIQPNSTTTEKRVQLPSSVLPSKDEIPFSYTSHMNIEPSLQGFQPDMDPHLRQVLEALDDEVFVDDELEDDFFQSVVKGGEWNGKVLLEGDEWRQMAPEGDEAIWMDAGQRAQSGGGGGDAEENLSLEARVALFKKQQEMERRMDKGKAKHDVGSDDEAQVDDQEERDQLQSLPPASRAGTAYTVGGSVLGKKGKPSARARRAATTKAPSIGGGSTAWSMSSSAMFRNKGLTDLDDRFEKLGREYGIKEEDDDDLDQELRDLEDQDFVDSDGEEAEEHVSREDFENIMDDFLDNYEVTAGKLRESLGGNAATSDQKLEMVRKALGEARIGQDEDEEEEEGRAGEDYMAKLERQLNHVLIPRSMQREKWDVETVLTTKTNLENHPRTISASESVRGVGNTFRPGQIASSVAASITSITSQRPNAAAFLDDDERLPKIRINPRTGFPEIVGYTKPRKSTKTKGTTQTLTEGQEDDGRGPPSDDQDSGIEDGFDSDATEGPYTGTFKRDRNETKEDRKARKETLKSEKKERREQKSKTKKTFEEERKKQLKAERGRKETEGGPCGMRL